LLHIPGISLDARQRAWARVAELKDA
jgi:hypothetical protein